MFKIVTVVLVAISSLFSVVADSKVEINLLENGDFALINSKGVPVRWNFPNIAKQEIAEDKLEKPDGVTASIKVSIKNSHKNYGQIVQTVKVIPNTDYILSGTLKATMPKLAFFQVKLRSKNKTIKRITSSLNSTGWETINLEFSTETADKIIVLCRFIQSAKAAKETVWFADLKLVKKGSVK